MNYANALSLTSRFAAIGTTPARVWAKERAETGRVSALTAFENGPRLEFWAASGTVAAWKVADWPLGSKALSVARRLGVPVIPEGAEEAEEDEDPPFQWMRDPMAGGCRYVCREAVVEGFYDAPDFEADCEVWHASNLPGWVFGTSEEAIKAAEERGAL